jgi:hypothetical protein
MYIAVQEGDIRDRLLAAALARASGMGAWTGERQRRFGSRSGSGRTHRAGRALPTGSGGSLNEEKDVPP